MNEKYEKMKYIFYDSNVSLVTNEIIKLLQIKNVHKWCSDLCSCINVFTNSTQQEANNDIHLFYNTPLAVCRPKNETFQQMAKILNNECIHFIYLDFNVNNYELDRLCENLTESNLSYRKVLIINGLTNVLRKRKELEKLHYDYLVKILQNNCQRSTVINMISLFLNVTAYYREIYNPQTLLYSEVKLKPLKRNTTVVCDMYTFSKQKCLNCMKRGDDKATNEIDDCDVVECKDFRILNI